MALWAQVQSADCDSFKKITILFICWFWVYHLIEDSFIVEYTAVVALQGPALVRKQTKQITMRHSRLWWREKWYLWCRNWHRLQLGSWIFCVNLSQKCGMSRTNFQCYSEGEHSYEYICPSFQFMNENIANVDPKKPVWTESWRHLRSFQKWKQLTLSPTLTFARKSWIRAEQWVLCLRNSWFVGFQLGFVCF